MLLILLNAVPSGALQGGSPPYSSVSYMFVCVRRHCLLPCRTQWVWRATSALTRGWCLAVAQWRWP
jgi:hypothetical protein